LKKEEVEPIEIQNCVTRTYVNLFCLVSQCVKANWHPQFQASPKGFLEQIIALHLVSGILLQASKRRTTVQLTGVRRFKY